MAYSSGSTILDDDYNIFSTGNAAGTGDNTIPNVNTLWGNGSAISGRGWGQSGTLSPVTAGTTVTATQWAALINRITTIANHTGTSITSISVPNIGNTIEAYSALSTNITSIFNDSQSAVANGTDSTTTNSTTSSWSSSAVLVKTFTWANADQMRYFFGAGGMIRLGLSRTGGTSSPQNTAWTNFLTAMGTSVMTGASSSKTIAGTSYTGFTKIGGSGTPDTINVVYGQNYFVNSLTPATYYTLLEQTDTGYLYTANVAKIEAQINAAFEVLTFRITLTDDSTGGSDLVDGTLSASWTVRPPSTTYISSTWGTVTANSPSWTLT